MRKLLNFQFEAHNGDFRYGLGIKLAWIFALETTLKLPMKTSTLNALFESMPELSLRREKAVVELFEWLKENERLNAVLAAVTDEARDRGVIRYNPATQKMRLSSEREMSNAGAGSGLKGSLTAEQIVLAIRHIGRACTWRELCAQLAVQLENPALARRGACWPVTRGILAAEKHKWVEKREMKYRITTMAPSKSFLIGQVSSGAADVAGNAASTHSHTPAAQQEENYDDYPTNVNKRDENGFLRLLPIVHDLRSLWLCFPGPNQQPWSARGIFSNARDCKVLPSLITDHRQIQRLVDEWEWLVPAGTPKPFVKELGTGKLSRLDGPNLAGDAEIIAAIALIPPIDPRAPSKPDVTAITSLEDLP